MKKLIFIMAVIAIICASCNQNEPEKSVTTNLEGRVYFCKTTGENYDVECYLLFKSKLLVVDSTALKWHVDPSGIDAPDPTVWSYKLDGELLTLHNDNPYTGDYYATYRDSVIYKGSLVYRKQ